MHGPQPAGRPVKALASVALLYALLSHAAWAACLACHGEHVLAAGDAHSFIAETCSACHLGDPAASDAETAHSGLVASPGELDNAGRSCGVCHAEATAAVSAGLMHTGRGMVNVTRFTFGEQDHPHGDGDLSRLAHSPADSLLRKRCASCHLGQPREQFQTEHPIGSRGGGCLACHLPHERQAGHPALTARVGDEQCLGCHSRSGRIALSYAGLGEVDDDALARADTAGLGYLPDGRLVERLQPDLHHAAGLSCIDCHTVRDLMGPTDGFLHGSDAVDIQCRDCHANTQPPVALDAGISIPDSLRRRIPFPVRQDQMFLVTERNRTPLWHIQVTPAANVLHRKIQGGAVRIPPLSAQHHPADGPHDRLGCTACHTQWAPQCHGCHMNFDPDQEQWDHAAGEFTPGAWVEYRWAIRNEQPPLGVDANDRIVPFVPGMIRTVEHPDWSETRFRRLFAPLAPHTTGKGLGCRDCHGSARALGLGEGVLHHDDSGWSFHPARPLLADGLPDDGFVTLSGRHGEATRANARGFTPEELQRILGASIPERGR